MAERREQMLGELAEWMHAAAREAQRRLLEAETSDEFVKLTGSLAKLGRGVRQAILVQRKLEAERLAGDRETAAQAAAEREAAVEARRSRVAGAVGRRMEAAWPDEGRLDDNEAFNVRLAALDERLDGLSETEDVLDLDPDALIARLCAEFGLPSPDAGDAAEPGSAGTWARSPHHGEAGAAAPRSAPPAASANGHDSS